MSNTDINQNRKGYKKTKIGWIPKDWSICSFTDALNRTGTPVDIDPEAEYREIGIRSHGKGIFHKEPTTGAALGNKRVFHLEAGCLMLNIVFAWEQAVAVSSKEEEGLIASHRFPMYQPNPGWDIDFIAYYLKTIRGKYSLGMASPGGAGRNRTLGQSELDFLMLPKASQEEQRKIKEILLICDSNIHCNSALIEAQRNLLKGLMQKLLTGEKRLLGFKGRWKSHKLDSLLIHQLRPVVWSAETVFHLISVRRRSKGLFRREPLRGDQYKTTDLHTIESGDFLVSKRQVAHGALAMVTDEFNGCHVSKEYTIFVNRAPEKLHMPFLDWRSKTTRMWWMAYVASSGVTLEKLIFAPKDFLKFEIKLPPSLEEQKAISEVLETAASSINKLETKLEALKSQKKALMQKLLTGHTRVKA